MVTPDQAIDAINKVYGAHPRSRALHAKGQFYAATFTATPGASRLTRAAHMTGAPIPTLVRLSNGSGRPHSVDKAPDVRGLAVSFRPPGSDATDILAQTGVRFPVRTPEAFLEFTSAAAQPNKPWLLAAFVARNPRVLGPLLANLRARAVNPPRSFADIPYYAIHAYKWLDADGGSRWVRYTWRPEASPAQTPKVDGRNYLHEEMQQRLANGPVRFTLEVQIAADGDNPHDPTSVWRGAGVEEVGTLEITAPAPDPEADGGVTVFDPTRIIDGIELSDDPILRFRPQAYSVSVDRRLKPGS
jgi:catalase